jgi:hypothetical protein
MNRRDFLALAAIAPALPIKTPNDVVSILRDMLLNAGDTIDEASFAAASEVCDQAVAFPPHDAEAEQWAMICSGCR